jgi:16S rRNA G966 N2-methylase RsmD
LLEEKGLIICEHTEEIEVPFEILKQKKYGPKKVTILTKSN